MRRKISQREARTTAKQLKELAGRWGGLTQRYSSERPGVFLGELAGQHDSVAMLVNTSRAVGCGVAVKMSGNILQFYAVKP